MKIIAVVVTYNRLDFLKQNLKSLETQSRNINKIIVLDNASTDGTKEYLKEKKINSKYTIINLNENTGGAGGFYKGIEESLKEDYDYIWLMDDDCVPLEDCLEKLVEKIKNDSVAATFGLLEDFNSKINFVGKEVNKDIENKGFPFAGVLIKREIIERIGLPEKDYFIYGDDSEYSLRILENNLGKILLIHNAIVKHPIKFEFQKIKGKKISKYELNKLWVYYKTRNYFLIRNKHSYKMGLIGKLYGILRELKIIPIYLYINRIDLLKLKIKAILDGLKNKKGKIEL